MMLLKEIKLPDIRTQATSNLTAKHLDIRYDNNYHYTVAYAFVQLPGSIAKRIMRSLRGAQNKPWTLTVLYDVDSTFDDGVSLPNNIIPAEAHKYHVIVQFQDIMKAEQASGLKWKQFLKYKPQEQQRLIQAAINTCDVKLYSDDPSFYYQGVHEILDAHGCALYPFTGPKGTGQWKARHQASGGLHTDFHVTKHIAQISEQIGNDWQAIVQQINQNQSIQESTKLDYERILTEDF